MSAVVLDASAGAEIVARSSLARRLLSLAPRDRQWWVPDHFHVEAAGAVRRMLLRCVIDEARATSAIERLLTLPVVVSRNQPLISEAWTLRKNIIIHDAVYVAFARHLGAPLLTGDRRLAGAPNLPVQILHLSACSPKPAHLRATASQLDSDVGLAPLEMAFRRRAGKRGWGKLDSADVCAVCHRTKALGNWSADGDVFVCADCQIDAQHFLSTQDQIEDKGLPAASEGCAKTVVDPRA